MKKLSLLPRSPWWTLNEIQLLVVLVLSVLFLYLGALTIRTYREADITGKPLPYLNSISVMGKGVVRVTPDIAHISAGLQTTAATVEEAQKTNTEKMNAFTQKVQALGVVDADRKTTSYSISPKYDDKQIRVGYTVSQTLEIKVRNLESLGALLARIGESGLNQVGSFQFAVDDEGAAKKHAMARAIKDAQEKAEILAKVSGTRLGKLTAFYENQDYPVPYASEVRAEISESGTPTPLPQAGMQEIAVSVTLSYEIK